MINSHYDHHHDDESGDDSMINGTSGLQIMGMINAFKTGDIYIDMMIAMLIPILIRYILQWLSKLDKYIFNYEYWINLLYQRHTLPTRNIVYKTQRTSWGSSVNLEEDSHNAVLLKAIQLYLHQQCHISLKVSYIHLTSVEHTNENNNNYNSYHYYNNDDENDNAQSKTLAGTLSTYKIIQKPPMYTWHKIGMFGTPATMVQLYITENEESTNTGTKDSDMKSNYTITYQLVSSSSQAIDTFIDTAYQWYIKELQKMDDKSRYLYEVKTLKSSNSSSSNNNSDFDDDGNSTSSGLIYQRYKLSDEKTFDSLFFREKDHLLNIINHFQSKTGKYAISGYPHKLGLLLHGPPGTGKTSMIKALAQYTGRSIVNVPLSRISTNSELMDIFFENRYTIRGVDVPVRLGFKDVIFVLEDVDAASKVVRRRRDIQYRDHTYDESIVETTETIVDVPITKSTWKMLLESTNSDCQEVVKQLMEKSDRLKLAAKESDVLESIARRMKTAVPGISYVGEEAENDAVANVIKDAVNAANNNINDIDTIDRFLGLHAQSIKAMLEHDVEISETFVDELLGVSSIDEEMKWKSIPCTPVISKQRDISYSRYDDRMEETLFGYHNDSAPVLPPTSNFTSCEPMVASGDGKNSDKELIGPSIFKPKKDQLNLTGLLNVLDGVVDTPGRILIMTTNHPEMLDPALIRPGRIDKKIMLGYMCSTDVISMLEHYFQTNLSPEQKHRVENALTRNGTSRHHRLTPAQIEQLTAESDEVDDMIQVLEERSQRFASPATAATSPMSTSSASLA